MSYPYKAVALKKYKSPHKEDLSFAKGDEIRVVALAPKDEDDEDDDDDDDDQWLVGESLDGSKTGTFPASHIQRLPQEQQKEDDGAGVSAAGTGTGAVATTENELSQKGTEAEPREVKEDAPVESEPAALVSSAPSAPAASAEADSVAAAASPADEAPTSAGLPKDAPQPTSPGATKGDSSSAAEAGTKAGEVPPAAAAAEPPKKPSSPPLAPKPSGLAARIAAFNKPSEAPPPLPKGKPGAWKRPPPAPGAPKPVLPGVSPAQQDQQQKKPQAAPAAAAASAVSAGSASSPPPASASADAAGEAATTTTTTTERSTSTTNAGFSAADAKSSIQLSLKERMAALQRGETQASAPVPAPKPAPKRIGADRRTAAMAGLGGPTSGAATTTTDPESELAPAKSSEEKSGTVDDGAERQSQDADIAVPGEAPAGEDAETGEAVKGADVGDEGEQATEHQPDEEESDEKTEEEKEAERRAAIAKRMAALGGRRMGGGGPPMFGAPAPVPAPKPKPKEKEKEPAAAAAEETKIEEAQQEPLQEKEPATKDEAVQRAGTEEEGASAPKTLAVPRRAAPPRRKRSAQPVEEDKEKQTSVDSSSTGDAAVSPVAATSVPPQKDTEAVSDAPMTEEPVSEAVQEEDHIGAAPAAISADEGERTEARTASLLIPGDRNGASGEPSPTTPASEIELREQARRLDEFVQSQQDDTDTELPTQLHENLKLADEDEDEDEDRDEVTTGAVTHGDTVTAAAAAAAAVAREPGHGEPTNARIPPVPVASPPPPSSAPPRPPSARPPVPKTPLSPPPLVADEEGARQSPAPTRAPPVPRAASRQGSAIIEPVAAPPAVPAAATHAPEDEGSRALPPQLTAPKPRMAVPVDTSDDEAEDDDEAAPAPAEEGQAEEESEEQQEAQRRASLAQRMARMGGQPIMGAPMPIRRKPTVEESRSVDERGPEANEDIALAAGGAARDDEEEQQGDEDEEPVRETAPRLASPPPVPKSPPPVPSVSPPPRGTTPASRHSMQAADSIERRMSYQAGSDGPDASLGRRASQIRPPVPSVTHSRDTSAQHAAPAEEETEEEEEQQPAIVPDRRASMSPPQLPSSPPPRAPPSRPPPQREAEAAPPAEAVEEDVRAVPPKATSISPSASSTIPPPRSAAAPPSRSSRDLDLMPSTKWWRHGLHPVRLPPTLQRPDALVSVDIRGLPSQNNVARHLITVQLVFEDYSSTLVYVEFQDDDGEEAATNVTQRHAPPPARPSAAQLTSWSTQIGAGLALQASAAVSAKSAAAGSSKDFVANLVKANPQTLGPVGSSFGAIILAQAGSTTVDRGADEEVRPGDVVALHGADLKGKKGITNYHATFGTPQEPTFAIVVESESKKRKLRCVLQGPAGSAGGSTGSRLASAAKGPEEVSLRLDDVKGGLVRVFRVAPRVGWLED